MMESSDFMPLGNAKEWFKDTATCHLSRCVVGGKVYLKKSLHAHFLHDVKMRACLRKEYETGCLLSKETPYVVNYHQLIDTQTECAIVMDFVDGMTLDAFVQADSSYFLDAAHLDTFMCQMLDALKAIHHAQVVHLDIKPTNLLLTSVNKDLRIIDFGLSYISTYPHTEGLTVTFAAPEQRVGGEVDCRTDIYAIGKILEYIEAQMRAKGQADKKMRTAAYRLPMLWRKMMSKCLQQKKEDRWQTIEDMIAYRLAEKGKEAKRKSGTPMRKVLGMVVGLLMVAIGAWAYWYVALQPGGVMFSDEYGNRYVVKSADSLTCCLMGRADTCTSVNLYIEPTVSFKGKRYQVVEIADSAFLRDGKIQTLCLPHTLREIGSRAFRECDQLLVADIPDEVEKMDNMVFWGCTRLSEVHIPKNLKRIPSSCFSKTALVKVEIPEGVCSIGYDAFGVCTRLREVSLPQSLLSLERGVFWRCSSLKSIHIPSEVHDIGQFCLMECDSLKNVYNDTLEPQRVVKLFGKKTSSHLVLHVPASSVEAYRKAECWGDVRQIVAR